MSKKILRHIDKEEIIERLTNGESVRTMDAWLKEKYPTNKNLWLSSVTLQKFRKNKLQLDGLVLKDIQEAGKADRQILEEQKRQKVLESSDAYKKKINEIVDSKLDVARKILQLDAVIESRMEYWFNAVSSGEETAIKGDKELRQFMDRQMALLAQYKKFVEGMADKTVEHNVNITVFNDQLSIVRDVIRECLSDFEPAQAMLFMEKLNSRLSDVHYEPRKIPEEVKLEDLQEAEFELIGETNGK